MTEWIDLNASSSRPARQLARALCESRIARATEKAIGAFARSLPVSGLRRAISSVDWDERAMQLAPIAYFAAGMAFAALVGWMRPVG
jgi:hypothetical protein